MGLQPNRSPNSMIFLNLATLSLNDFCKIEKVLLCDFYHFQNCVAEKCGEEIATTNRPLERFSGEPSMRILNRISNKYLIDSSRIEGALKSELI